MMILYQQQQQQRGEASRILESALDRAYRKSKLKNTFSNCSRSTPSMEKAHQIV